ncbi:MAG TPA: glycosyltransferase, partial [Planctomycetota bacterium]|nr:glycosyltransferase [Planctomycetota bacterium]
CEPNRELARSLGLAGDAPLIGVVASLHPWKGHRMFIRAAGIVHRARPDVRFLIVGGGTELAVLQALARDVGVSEAVVFAGARKDVPELLALMSIFALSSPSEGLPNAVLEAMACARPVVATRAGGTAEVVDHGNTGYLVPVGEHAALAEKLLVMLADPARAEEMGSRGRQRALAEFSGKRLVESVTQLYEALLA